jgi:multimeric flavodoxin WrbA
MTRVLAINGSYRAGGITDQTVSAMSDALQNAGAEVETIYLREYPINFCYNCRQCTQAPGEQPGHCVQHDGMQLLIEKIEAADGFILASPTNFSTVTAVYKRFMERLVVYAYWPWGTNIPKFRKAKLPARKKAVVISSSAAPGWMGKLFFHSIKQLKLSAKTVGARTIAVFFSGQMPLNRDRNLPAATLEKARRTAMKLIR